MYVHNILRYIPTQGILAVTALWSSCRYLQVEQEVHAVEHKCYYFIILLIIRYRIMSPTGTCMPSNVKSSIIQVPWTKM